MVSQPSRPNLAPSAGDLLDRHRVCRGGLFLAPSLGEKDPAGQVNGINLLFVALVIVVAGSVLGELFGLNQLLEGCGFGLAIKVGISGARSRLANLVAVGLVFWLFLLFRGVAPSRNHPERREIIALFMYAAWPYLYFICRHVL